MALLGRMEQSEHPAIGIPDRDRDAAEHLLDMDLARRTPKGGLAITAAGRAHLERRRAGEGAFRAQHSKLSAGDGGVRRNTEESPLDWLRRRQKPGAGASLISLSGFTAGERLRSDFTLAQMMPRVTMNWEAAIASGRRGGAGHAADLGDVAVAARQRLAHALDAVGGEFSGLLLDVCCFLKGLEAVESERGWPGRSAKVVLGLALERLARHYGIAEVARGPERSGGIRHWGAADYRPRIDGG